MTTTVFRNAAWVVAWNEARAAHVAKRLKLQHAILAEIGRHDVFRRGSPAGSLTLLCEKAATYPIITRACVYRCEPDGNTLTPLALVDNRPAEYDHINTLGTTSFAPSGIMDDMTEPNVISDLQSDPGISDYRQAYSKTHGLRGAIDMPIMKDGHVAGVFCLRTCGEPHVWSQEEVMFAGALATCASWVFERTDRQKAEVLVTGVAERLKLQQTILSDIVRHDKFRHGAVIEAIAILNEYATKYQNISRSTIYYCAAGDSMLVPMDLYDRRQDRHYRAGAVPTTYFAPNGEVYT